MKTETFFIRIRINTCNPATYTGDLNAGFNNETPLFRPWDHLNEMITRQSLRASFMVIVVITVDIAIRTSPVVQSVEAFQPST